MEFKKLTIPIILAALSLIFLITSFAVYLHNGQSAKWVARKMRIGGLMLTLTAILSACDPAQTAALEDTNPPWTCYLVAAPQEKENRFYVNNQIDSLVTLNFPLQNTIEGEIKKRTFEQFSFAVVDTSGMKVQIENIEAADGTFDESEESFKIQIDKSLEKGDYIVRFYNAEKEFQSDWSEQYINLKIK